MNGHFNVSGYFFIQGASGVKAQSVNKVGNTSFGLLDSCSKLEQKTNIDVLSKEFLENLNFVSSRGISDVSRHRNMVQVLLFWLVRAIIIMLNDECR